MWCNSCVKRAIGSDDLPWGQTPRGLTPDLSGLAPVQSRHPPQRVQVDYLDVLGPHFYQPFFLKARHRAADRLELETEIAPDLFARHPQVELGR